MPVCGTHVCVCVYICGATLWFVFFLYRWFCPLVCVPGSVSFPRRDGLVMHREVESGQISSCLLWFLSHSLPCCGLSLSIPVSLFPFICHYLLRVEPFIFFCLLNPPRLSQFPSICSVSLSPSLSLSFLHHKHFHCWHTRVDSHTESSATTIMSTLSSHNNTRITCWGRRALLGAVSQTWLPWIECQHFTELHLWKCEDRKSVV